MIYDLTKFDELVEQGYLRRVENGSLVLYNYTDKCTYDKHWNEYTIIARGIILEKETGKVIAKPFSKFWNLGEREETFFKNLPELGYTPFEKLDGSLGILFYYENKWNVVTRGSFTSDQAIKGTEILKKYNTEVLNKNLTYITEIIYPENKIVINYGSEEKLVGLAIFNPETGKEINTLEDFKKAGMTKAKSYPYTIEDMIELQKTIPKDQEGFVVKFDNGFRVKIKGDEYMKIARILSHMTPLSFWEVMKDGRVPTSYLQQLPEEFRPEFEEIVKKLEDSYWRLFNEIYIEYLGLPLLTFIDNKDMGLYLLKENAKHKQALWHVRNDNKEALDKYILKLIRPKSNII